jgi:hypothetical protein
MKRRILGFIHGFTWGLSGLLPGAHTGKKTIPHKRVGGKQCSAARAGIKRKQKLRRVGSGRVRLGLGRNGRLKRAVKSIRTVTDKIEPNLATHVTVYTCPACGLQGAKSMMVEHLMASPLHRLSVRPEQTADHKVEEAQAVALREEDSRDSLRNLLQILLPPRAFGRRHEQRAVKL